MPTDAFLRKSNEGMMRQMIDQGRTYHIVEGLPLMMEENEELTEHQLIEEFESSHENRETLELATSVLTQPSNQT